MNRDRSSQGKESALKQIYKDKMVFEAKLQAGRVKGHLTASQQHEASLIWYLITT